MPEFPKEQPLQSGFSVVDLGVHTLRHVHLALEPGQCVGLTGASGSGKSLFLRALADLDPHAGSMYLDGVAADRVPAPRWRRQVGLLPAESAWWHDTVGPHFEQVPKPWLGELGFNGGVMDWQVSRLSSGERQRLALLRLLIQKPRVLLLDEPTANLDRRNTQCVESLLVRYRQEHAVMMIWVSHDPEQLQRNCAPIFAIAGNRLEPFDGRPDGQEAP
ncbi:MAG: ABC transporter ATP-binding protein [Desulfobacteraceae bacterium]|jgi:ABC-type iron transport system FetAB ATPase subunit